MPCLLCECVGERGREREERKRDRGSVRRVSERGAGEESKRRVRVRERRERQRESKSESEGEERGSGESKGEKVRERVKARYLSVKYKKVPIPHIMFHHPRVRITSDSPIH